MLLYIILFAYNMCMFMPLCLSHYCFEYCWYKSVIDFYYWSCIWQTCSSLLFVLILSVYFIFQGKGSHHQQRTVLSLPFQPLYLLFCLLLAVAWLWDYVLSICFCLVTKLCPTLCDPTDYSPPGSSVCGIAQERILEWAGISFSTWVQH